MYGLPLATEHKLQLPKKELYAKFNLKPSQREHFDADVARMEIVAAVSPTTIPALEQGREIKELYVLVVHMKRQDYDVNNILMLAKLIPQKIVFALQYENQTQFALFYQKLILSAWQDTEKVGLPLQGLDLDIVWENLVKDIGQIEVAGDNTLAEQIAVDELKAKLLDQIVILERKMFNEKQSRRKREYFKQIQKLKEQI